MVRNSTQSVQLANVQRQLRSGKTRGTNPRPLTLEEVQSLEVRRDKLQAEMSEAKRRRVVDRVNTHTHTTQESEETRRAVREEGEHTRKAMQPIIDLITVKDTDNKRDAIVARQTQIALSTGSQPQGPTGAATGCGRSQSKGTGQGEGKHNAKRQGF